MDRLAAMEVYVSVVEAGSLSAAARRLQLNQPAVSKSVAKLEEHLGVRLLVRSPRGLSMTEAGQRFYDEARRVIEQAELAEQAVREAGSSLTGRLRASAAVSFARLHVVPALRSFLELHPALKMDLILDDRIVDLLEEGMDLALRMGKLPDSNMTARRLARAPRFVIGSPGYFERAGVPRTPAELSTHEAIVYAQGGGGESWVFRRDGVETAVVVSGQLSVSAAEGMREAVLADIGLAVASEWMFSPELKDGRVRAVLLDWELPPVDLWAVFPAGRMVSAKARAFADFVERTLNPADQSHVPAEEPEASSAT